jgi:hypothetical protein
MMGIGKRLRAATRSTVGSHRHDDHWRPGERKAIKQQLGKHARRNARLALRRVMGVITLQFVTTWARVWPTVDPAPMCRNFY